MAINTNELVKILNDFASAKNTSKNLNMDNIDTIYEEIDSCENIVEQKEVFKILENAMFTNLDSEQQIFLKVKDLVESNYENFEETYFLEVMLEHLDTRVNKNFAIYELFVRLIRNLDK
jgi:hypothetical protein